MKPNLIVFSHKKEVCRAALTVFAGRNLPLFCVSRWRGLTGLLRKDRRSLVFVDAHIQKSLGSWIYEEIKTLSPGTRIILICTPPNSRVVVKEAMNAGVYGCLGWPLKKWEAMTLVDGLLRDME